MLSAFSTSVVKIGVRRSVVSTMLRRRVATSDNNNATAVATITTKHNQRRYNNPLIAVHNNMTRCHTFAASISLLNRRCFSKEISKHSDSDSLAAAKEEEILEVPYHGAHPVYLEADEDGGYQHKLLEWYKEVGDAIEAEEPLCSIDTDVVEYDITAPFDGVLAAKKVKQGTAMGNVETLICLVVGSQAGYDAYVTASTAAKGSNNDDVAMLTNVSAWLNTLTPDSDMGQEYSNKFEEEGFDSIDALKTITDDDLIEMGVKKGHRRLIVDGVEQLQRGTK